MSADERKQNERLLEANRRRLNHLNLQRARQGNDTPPHVVTEIEDLEASIADLEIVVQSGGQAKQEAKDARRDRFGDDLEFLIAQNRSITNRQTAAESAVGEIAKQVKLIEQNQGAAAQWRLQVQDDIQTLITAVNGVIDQNRKTEKKRRQLQPVFLFMFIAIAVAVIGLYLRLYW